MVQPSRNWVNELRRIAVDPSHPDHKALEALLADVGQDIAEAVELLNGAAQQIDWNEFERVRPAILEQCARVERAGQQARDAEAIAAGEVTLEHLLDHPALLVHLDYKAAVKEGRSKGGRNGKYGISTEEIRASLDQWLLEHHGKKKGWMKVALERFSPLTERGINKRLESPPQPHSRSTSKPVLGKQ